MNRGLLEDTIDLFSNSVGRGAKAAQDVNRYSFAFSN
jgi:hypothetical protein